MRSVARVLGYLMAVLIGLAATVIAVLFSVQSPAAAIPVGANVTIHTDDAPGYDAHENYTAPERGPPADLDTTYDPDGPRSLGVLTRPHTPIAPSTHDYDDIAPFVHTAGASQRVEEPDGDPESSHAVVQRLQVAANIVRTAAPSTFTRAEALSGRASSRKVDEIAASMRANGWQGAPIDVVELQGQRIVVDGHHRLAAARRAGIDVQYRVVDPSTVVGPGRYTSIDDILQSSYSVGRDRLR